MTKPPDARLAAALRENLRRRKAQPKSKAPDLAKDEGETHLDDAAEGKRPAPERE